MFPFLFISTQNFNSLFFVYLLRAPYHSERTRVTKYLLSCVVVRASLLGSESFDPLAIAQPEVWDRRATIDRAPPLVTSRERYVNAYVTALWLDELFFLTYVNVVRM